MITLNRAQRFLVYSATFFGPLGSILSPSFLPYAFRFYYFFLLFFPLFFVNLQKDQWKTVLSFIPFLSYCLISAYFTHNKQEIAYDSYPLFRCFLLACQCLFMFGAVFALRDEEEEKRRLIRLYLSGFFLSLMVGYFFYFGYYLGLLSFQTIQKYCVEAQIGWGLLRFSPGSYPNEYGNISSFVLCVLLLMYSEKKRFWIFCFFSLTFLAFLLTTTRAAYLSFFISLIYLTIAEKVVRTLVLKLSLSALALLLVLKWYSIDFFKIFIKGIKAISFTYGSTGIRVSTWLDALFDFDKSILFGNGFGANMRVHNVYSIFLFELGLIGCLILLVTLIYHFSENSRALKKTLLSPIIVIGLIHILLFAMTNHNMHHHLTWFVLLLFNLYPNKFKITNFSSHSSCVR